MERFFGTDGVRGKAGQYPLDAVTIRRFGAALARALRPEDGGARFLAGLDTRESGAWIVQELAVGVRSQGGTLTSAGVIPTPAVAYLTPRMGYTAGVVISASHNPFADNGMKVFSGAGEKFTRRLEEHVESIVSDSSWGIDDAGRGESGPGLIPPQRLALDQTRSIASTIDRITSRTCCVSFSLNVGIDLFVSPWTVRMARPQRWHPTFLPTSGSMRSSLAASLMDETSISVVVQRRRSCSRALLSNKAASSESPTTATAIGRSSSALTGMSLMATP